MKIPILMTVLTASVLAISLAYSALPWQRWWHRPFRRFPARATAIMAALVAFKGWVEMLGLVHGTLTLISTLGVPLGLLFAAGDEPLDAHANGKPLHES